MKFTNFMWRRFALAGRIVMAMYCGFTWFY